MGSGSKVHSLLGMGWLGWVSYKWERTQVSHWKLSALESKDKIEFSHAPSGCSTNVQRKPGLGAAHQGKSNREELSFHLETRAPRHTPPISALGYEVEARAS